MPSKRLKNASDIIAATARQDKSKQVLKRDSFMPNFPLTLCERLAHALQAQDAEIAMAAAPEPDAHGQPRLRPQPVFCLLRTHLLDSLRRFTQQGGRKIDAWTAQHRQVIVPFDEATDDPHAFANANTLAELRALEQAQ